MVKYPSQTEELDIVRKVTGGDDPDTQEVVDAATIIEFQRLVRRIPVSDHVNNYAVALVRATRPDAPDAPEFVKKLMAWGVGPRASLNLVLAGKARAAMRALPRFDRRHQGAVFASSPTPNHSKFYVRRRDPDRSLPAPDEVPSDENLLGKSQLAATHVSELPDTNYLDPELLQRMGDLELIAREVVEGLRLGVT